MKHSSHDLSEIYYTCIQESTIPAMFSHWLMSRLVYCMFIWKILSTYLLLSSFLLNKESLVFFQLATNESYDFNCDVHIFKIFPRQVKNKAFIWFLCYLYFYWPGLKLLLIKLLWSNGLSCHTSPKQLGQLQLNICRSDPRWSFFKVFQRSKFYAMAVSRKYF